MTDAEPVTPDAPPLPGRVVVNQSWLDLTWLHWALDPGRVAAYLPAGVRPDVIDGRTYVGLVPFRMVDLGPGRRGRLHRLGTFLETNVRLYSVDAQGRRGVVFRSLDTDRLLMVPGARAYVGAPYRWAAMSYAADGDVRDYHCRVRGRGERPVSHVRVRVGAEREPTALDEFLSARWAAHTRHLGRTLRVPNRHERWRVHDAELLDLDDQLVPAALGGSWGELGPPDEVAFSPGVHAEFSLPQIVRTGVHG